MELLFNELSITSPSANKYDANQKMKIFSETVATARNKGFRNIRSHYDSHQIELANDYSLYNWLTSKDVPEIFRNNLYGMIILPFISEDDEEIEAQFVEANYLFEDAANGISKTKCLGLASACLYETLSISLQSSNAWTKNSLNISVESIENTRIEAVRNIFSKGCFNVKVISDFVELLETVVLHETSIPPDSKKFHLADHHGQNELKALWTKLKTSPYVVEGRSTDWGGKRFIRKVEKNGVLEIVLVDSERQYALWVQTTGTNLRETKAIAEMLDDRFA
jgi:hypothetical protein